MTNAAALIMYLPIVLVTATVMAIACYRDRQRPVIRSFLVLGVVAIGWEIAAMLYISSWTIPMATYLYDAKLPFVAMTPLALLVFVLHFYRLDYLVRPQLIILLGIVPLITAVLAVTSPWHSLLRTQLDIISLWPRQTVISQQGGWYWVHTIYCYILVIASGVVVVSQHIKLPKSRRVPSILIMGGAAVTLFCNILSIIGAVSYPFNLTPVSTGISAILFYLALCSCSKLDFLMLASTEIFHFMDDYVFILDTSERILDINQSAEEWLKELQIPTPVTHFREITQFLRESGAEFQYAEDHDAGTDVSIVTNCKTVIYNIQEKRITGDDGDELGMFITCNDVTRNRLLISRLEETAQVDALTGLQNRWGLDRMAARILSGDHLPITLIMGDINGLKTVNDSSGHQQGDLLLRETALVLKESCPPQGQAFRVGGDEFILLLPGCDRRCAEKVIRDIHQRLETLQIHPFQISISLGMASQNSPPFSLDDLMRRADEDMYRQKKSAPASLADAHTAAITYGRR